MKTKEFLNRLQRDELVAAIGKAEQGTSGEIRVFITRQEPDDAIAAAQVQFSRLGMEKTRHRNGVLIFVAPGTQRFAVIGDVGVHARCGDEFWRQVAAEMGGHFRRQDFSAGLLLGIERAGALLARHFPRGPDDRNELPDELAGD
jgi:uncharacterized membrane protein